MLKTKDELTTETTTGCPYHNSSSKTLPVTSHNEAAIEQGEDGTWHIRDYAIARAILRSNNSKQAGFQAEVLGEAMSLSRDPMLYLEGSEHHTLRKQTARFFTPKAVKGYDDMIAQYVDTMLQELKTEGRLDLSDLSMKLAVRVAAEVVGLTNSNMEGMTNRLNAFFSLEPIKRGEQKTLSGIGRFLLGQFYTLRFYLFDVRPAIRARRETPKEDLITHLITQEYSPLEILTECILFGAAGMVTTREFIAVAAWHLLQNEELRADYLAADHKTRHDILHEILRLEPVVGNLYRRTTAPIDLEVGNETVTIPENTLLDLHIYDTNNDENALGTPTDSVCPQRDLPRGVQPFGMSFGDGSHRCPGAYIAIEETDLFLTRFLQIEGLHLEQTPTVERNDLVKGYEIRNFIVAVD